jgi:exosortase
MSDLTPSKTCDSSASAQPRGVSRAMESVAGPAGRRLALVLSFWAAVALLYWPSTLELHRLWTNWPHEAYTHGYLIFLLSIWLIVQDRKRLAGIPLRAEPLGLIPLALLSVAWVWFWRAAIQELQLLLLPVILLAALYSALGRRIARGLAFPIGFLYFALPFWDDINGIVQSLSAKVTEVLVWMTGIPAYVGGDLIHLPGGTIEIAKTCSGLHELIVGLALAAFYGKVSNEPWRRRLAWLGVMGALSLAINWVRIFAVVIAAYETDMRSSLVENHYWLGWWLFAFAFAAFLWWTGRRSSPPARATVPKANHRPSRLPSGPTLASATSAATVTLVVLAALPVLAYGVDWVNPVAGSPLEIRWPTAPAGWARYPAASEGEWQPHFVNSSGESLTAYTGPNGEPVQAFAVAYREQTQRAKLLGYSNHLLGRPGKMRQQFTRTLSSMSGRWREIVAVDSEGSRSLVWTRYRIGTRPFVEPRAAQLWYGLAAIVKPPVSSLTALRTPCLPDCKAARARLSAAAAWLHPVLP